MTQHGHDEQPLSSLPSLPDFGGPIPRAPRARVPFARTARLTMIFSVPVACALSALVLWWDLGIVPAAMAFLLIVLSMGFLFRQLISDWIGVANYLRPLPISGSPNEPFPVLHFSEGARDVASAARGLRQRAILAVGRAEAEAAAQASLLDALPDPLLMVNSHGLVIQANAAARTVLGRELENRALTAVLRDPAILEAVDQVLSGAIRNRDVQLVLGASIERTFQVEVQRLADDVPLPAHAVVVLHDITTLVRAEQMRADFVANASHELRTPLTSILGFVETLRGPARDDQEAQDRFLGIMYQQASRMRRLIEDLLSLSRIELREHTPPTAAVSLEDVIDGVVMGLEILAEDKDMPIEVSLEAHFPAVTGDADELTQVFQNLISNAIKYGKPGTPLLIRGERLARGPAQMPHPTRKDCVAIHVTDHGDGIAKEHLPRLTERFYRVDTARSRQLGGTGLGLAIVKHIVSRHRGALVVDSTVGKGSTFSVYLPIAGLSPPAPSLSDPLRNGPEEEI